MGCADIEVFTWGTVEYGEPKAACNNEVNGRTMGGFLLSVMTTKAGSTGPAFVISTTVAFQ